MANIHIPLLSISRPAWEAFALLPTEAYILGVFQRAIDIRINDSIVALVTPENKNGVFHLLVPMLPPPASIGTAALAVRQHTQGICIGHWLLAYSLPPPLWEPRVDWEALQGGLTRPRMAQLIAWLTSQPQEMPSLFSRVLFGEVPAVLRDLEQGLFSTQKEQLQKAVGEITGRGPGLTPAGDDFLAGIMLALHLYYANSAWRGDLCTLIYTSTIGKTTQLSQAFLQAASLGLADESWHIFFHALQRASAGDLEAACQNILAYGASSGWDMLNGFFWMMEIAFNDINTKSLDDTNNIRFTI